MFRLRYSSVSLVLYQTQTRYLPPVESRFQLLSSDSIMMDVATESFSLVKLEAFFPHSSIFPVDSGVLIARYLAFRIPVSTTEVGTLK